MLDMNNICQHETEFNVSKCWSASMLFLKKSTQKITPEQTSDRLSLFFSLKQNKENRGIYCLFLLYTI